MAMSKFILSVNCCSIIDSVARFLKRKVLILDLNSAGLTIVANVAIATGPALLGAPRSSVINLIYYIIYRIF